MSVLLGLMTVMSMLSVRIHKDHIYATVGKDLKAMEDHVKVNVYIFFLLCVNDTTELLASIICVNSQISGSVPWIWMIAVTMRYVKNWRVVFNASVSQGIREMAEYATVRLTCISK